MMDKIAILMSTYNGEKYIRKQLDSIVNQTIANDIHLYIRDDESSDSTIQIISEFEDKINLTLINGKNVGPAHSFWQLFMNSDIQAEYYAFCDQDDIWDSDKVEKAILKLQENDDEPVLYCSNCRIIDSDDNVIEKQMYMESPLFTIISQFVCGTTQGCAMVFNNKLREYIQKKEVKSLPMHDFVLMTYAIAAGSVTYDNEPSFGYRVHSGNVVAKNGKNIIKAIHGSLINWFSKKHRSELTHFAEIFYKDNHKYLDENTKRYIETFVNSKNNFIDRIRIIKNKETKSTNKRAERSFKIRVILGVI